ncbi:Epoxyqueuosine reductase [Mucisphaera calidilacus]|uniref:Epoxyqueuosine reductase n=1 Tax=Mucisphaera calidilacus TaxID=2527982 RepID=A0A518BX92_9BACT|nr:Epoxyqueuosine reductase [Mucisphaera calidilacus]
MFDAAEALGFGLVGVTDSRASDHEEHVRAWVADGQHGEMGYLAENLDVRLDPGRLLSGCRSIVCVADAYRDDVEPTEAGKTARYAGGRDYHRVMKRKLHALADGLRERYPGADFKTCVDTAPLLEREHAARAGLGWIGKHTLLIHPRHGSWLLLGCLLTTLEVETSEAAGYPGATVAPVDHCGTCTACIDACPTGCISPYAVDGSRCISYQTIEKRSPFTPEEESSLAGNLAGCDICQEVCPHNRSEQRVALPVRADYEPRGHARGLDPSKVVSWDESDRLRHLSGTALMRLTLGMLHRNARALLDGG